MHQLKLTISRTFLHLLTGTNPVSPGKPFIESHCNSGLVSWDKLFMVVECFFFSRLINRLNRHLNKVETVENFSINVNRFKAKGWTSDLLGPNRSRLKRLIPKEHQL